MPAPAVFAAELWKKEVIRQMQGNTVFAGLTNQTFVGKVSQAGSVKVPTIGGITIGDYVPGTAMARENPTPTMQSLIIDQAKFFNFGIDNIAQAQTNVDLIGAYTSQAGVDLALSVDGYIYSHFTDVAAGNIVGTDADPISLTAANIVSEILTVETQMNIAKASRQNRWLSVSSEVAQLVKEAQYNKYQARPEDASIGGFVSRIGMFTIVESDTVRPVSGVHNLLAGNANFINFVGQVDSMKPYEPEDNFEVAVKGLYVFGSKVFQGAQGGLLKGSVA